MISRTLLCLILVATILIPIPSHAEYRGRSALVNRLLRAGDNIPVRPPQIGARGSSFTRTGQAENVPHLPTNAYITDSMRFNAARRLDPNKIDIPPTISQPYQYVVPRTPQDSKLLDDVLSTPNPKRATDLDANNDPNFLKTDGWQKKKISGDINDAGKKAHMHYQYNERTELIADIKFIDSHMQSLLTSTK